MQELTAGDSPSEAALALKARLVVAHLPPHVKLSVTQPADRATPALRANGTDIPAGSTAALRWGCRAHCALIQTAAWLTGVMLSRCTRIICPMSMPKMQMMMRRLLGLLELYQPDR
jgi:hypothetical protein